MICVSLILTSLSPSPILFSWNTVFFAESFDEKHTMLVQVFYLQV